MDTTPMSYRTLAESVPQSTVTKPHYHVAANMDYSALPSKLQTAATRTCLPKRLLLCFATLAVIIVIVVVSIIFAIELPASTPGDGTDFFSDNETSTSTTEISTTDAREGDGLSTVTVDVPKFIADHRFYSVSDWRGRQPLYTIEVSRPISFVIVSHTAGVQCFTFADCATQMRNIQALHVNNGSPNIGYNFLIGGDGGIYEARGWHTRNFHRDFTIGISFMGNFVFDEFTDVMISAFDGILANGVKVGALPADFRIVAHNQTMATASPGQHVYSVISQYPNFYPGILPSAREPRILR
ncbi:peptidoglycan recognition protein [Holotrichia oblita]|uniref:Peptidoglycan recognition protein n=1 Tax=Holotrichia oblita TaxID=644536 RepID=A0ACB9TY88_HOLOL|nr:peptidoglycan recognition protein [Holotrichia oblita]